MTAPQEEQSLAERLGESRVGLRPELEFSRHCFRGVISYIVRDPVSFETHRISLGDYNLLVHIRPDKELSEIFTALVEKGILLKEREEEYYQFVITLHRRGFIQLQMEDSKRLYQRFVAKRASQRKQKILGVLFAKIPLFNPDQFLNVTSYAFRIMFTRGFFFAWLALLAAASYVAVAQWNELTSELAGIFMGQNLIALWLTLILLKVFHEFGHAYACKIFGGQVPEMGIMLIAFTPCAYVDASASWGFPSKLHRLIVCFGGMYVELAIAAIALLLWGTCEPGLTKSILHNIVVLASVVTIGFNINPLMRYDGYYAVSDMLEIPNLKQRANEQFSNFLKHRLLGVEVQKSKFNPIIRFSLGMFGVASAIYKVVVVLSISTVICMKFFVIGLVMGAFYITMEVSKTLKKCVFYLWFSPETAPVRMRSIGVSLAIVAIISSLLFAIPIPYSAHASGLVSLESQEKIHVKSPGILEELKIRSGDHVQAGAQVIRLSNLGLEEPLIEAQSEYRSAIARSKAFPDSQSLEARLELEMIKHHEEKLRLRQEQLKELRVHSPLTGTVIHCLPAESLGSFLPRGTEIATVVSGKFLVTTYLTQYQMSLVSPEVGDQVEFRAFGSPAEPYSGVIAQIIPAGTRNIASDTLTDIAGGDIALNPKTAESVEPYFVMKIQLDQDRLPGIRHGMTGLVRAEGKSAPIGVFVLRKILTFLNKLKSDS